MALSVVQAANGQAAVASGATVSATLTTTLGNLLVMISYQDKASTLTPTITDSAGQTWTQVGSIPTAGNGQLTMWFKANSASVTSVSVSWATYTATATITIVVYEVSGADSVSPLDTDASNPAQATNAATATSLASGSLNTANANDILLYGVGENVNTSGWSDAVNGFAIQTGGSITTGRSAMAWKIVSATQSGATTTMSWTTTGADRIGILAAFKAAAALVVGPDDTDIQQQRFMQSTRMESQHQHELQDSFGIPPPRPPFAYEDDGQNMRWSDWRALQYEDPETQRALPPIPPFAIQEEFTEQLTADWRARQYEDTDIHRALPPIPPLAVQNEGEDQRWAGYQVVFDDAPDSVRPPVVVVAPNIGLDDIEAHIKAYDRTNIYHEDDLSTLAPMPPFAFADEISEKWTSTSAPAIEDDQATLPPVPPLPQFSIHDDEQHTWRGWLAAAVEDDWTARAPIPPLAFEDDLKTISSSAIFFQIVDADFTGKPPLPPFFGDDQQSIQAYAAAGLSGLLWLDEFVNAPISGVGPASLLSLSASVRPAMESWSASARPAIEALSVAVRAGIESQNAAVRAAMEAQAAAIRAAMEAQNATVRPS